MVAGPGGWTCSGHAVPRVTDLGQPHHGLMPGTGHGVLQEVGA